MSINLIQYKPKDDPRLENRGKYDIHALKYLDLEIKLIKKKTEHNIETILDLATTRIQTTQSEKPLPLHARIWKWIKETCAAIAYIFREIFTCSDDDFDEESSPISKQLQDKLDSKLEHIVKKNPKDPAAWNSLIDFYSAELVPSQRIQDGDLQEIKQKSKVISRFIPKIRHELLKLIEKNPDLDVCLQRLGTVQGLDSPVRLFNDGKNSCYMDSLLQILFASKEFVAILNSTDPETVGIYKPLVTTLKNYSSAVSAGLEAKEMNLLRDEFKRSIFKLPENIRFPLVDNSDETQDVCDLLAIVLRALKIKDRINLDSRLTKVFNLGSFPKVDAAKVDEPVIDVGIPNVRRMVLEDHQLKKAKDLQRRYDSDYQIECEYAEDCGMPIGPRRDIVEEWTDALNQGNNIDLQQVVNAYFNVTRNSLDDDDICEAALAAAGIDPKSDLSQVQSKTLTDARNYTEQKEFLGDAPPVLFIRLVREVTTKKMEEIKGEMKPVSSTRINNQSVIIPKNEKVRIKIGVDEIEYRVLGIAGGPVHTGDGHYTAVTKLNKKWYHVDDLGARTNEMTSPNRELNTNGRLYMLERV